MDDATRDITWYMLFAYNVVFVDESRAEVD
jgi:hypothetical protein